MVEASSGGYPVVLTVADNNKVANWRPLAHWLLVIPHYIINYVLQIVSQVLAVVCWFIIVITGKLPEGLANFQIMYMRYSTRMTGFLLGMTEDYPPFTFDSVAQDPGDYAIGLTVVPELEDRNRLTVALRLLWMIPAAIVTAVFSIIAMIVSLVAWFAVLFTGTYPEGMRNVMIGVGRNVARLSAYVLLLTDEYPPFSLD